MSPGSLRWSETSSPESTETTLTLCTSRTRGTASAAACARSRVACSPPRGSTWTTTSASGSADCTARSTCVGRRVSLPDRLLERDADHDVGEVPARRLPHAQPPQLDGRLDRRDRAPRRRLLVGRNAVHQHVDVPAHQPHGGDEDERGDEQRRDRVRVVVAGAHEQQPDQHRDRAGEVAAEVERVRRERGAAVPARGARRRDRPRDVDHDHDADHGERVPRRVHLRGASGR